jgi:hypothetical protein
MRKLESDDINAKKKLLKSSKLNYKKAQQYQLQGVLHYAEKAGRCDIS